MKKLLVFIFAFAATITLADHQNIMWDPQGYPEDEYRGDWFATIDTDAVDHAIIVQSDVTRKGPTAIKFELRDGDCFTAAPHDPSSDWDDCTRDRERSELREKWYPELDTSVWYGISLYIPEDYEYMYPKQIFLQWHGGPGPVVYFQLNRDKFLIDILTEVGQTTTQYKMGTHRLKPGQWHDIVINAVWSNTDEGKFIFYLGGNKLLQHYGPTMDDQSYAKGRGPYTKFGIYRSHLSRWDSDEPHPTQILYFDEYRRGYRSSDVDVDNYDGD